MNKLSRIKNVINFYLYCSFQFYSRLLADNSELCYQLRTRCLVGVLVPVRLPPPDAKVNANDFTFCLKFQELFTKKGNTEHM